VITAGGTNVAPSALEDRVREHWLVAECVVVGDRRPHIAALVTLDNEAFARWKQRRGMACRLGGDRPREHGGVPG
jgi:long-chain acyl-CoA synthetase